MHSDLSIYPYRWTAAPQSIRRGWKFIYFQISIFLSIDLTISMYLAKRLYIYMVILYRWTAAPQSRRRRCGYMYLQISIYLSVHLTMRMYVYIHTYMYLELFYSETRACSYRWTAAPQSIRRRWAGRAKRTWDLFWAFFICAPHMFEFRQNKCSIGQF